MSEKQAGGAGAAMAEQRVFVCESCGHYWTPGDNGLCGICGHDVAEPAHVRELKAQLLEAELNCGETTGRNLELEAQLRGMEQERANESRHYKGRIAELESAVNTLRRMGECLKCVTHKKEIEKLNGLVEFHKSEHTANLDLIAERDAAREEREVLARDCERLKEKLHMRRGNVERLSNVIGAANEAISMQVILLMPESESRRVLLSFVDEMLAAKGAEQGKGE